MKRLPFNGLIAPALFAALTFGGCAKSVDNQTAANNAADAPSIATIEEPDAVRGTSNETATMPTDEWLGRWNGPEGLFLDIQPSPDGQPGHYALTNRDTLDREASYAGVAEGETIHFKRDGKDLAIRPGSGVETGFKYLADKKDCLIVVAGQEGYCR